MTGETFGQALRRYRVATIVTVLWYADGCQFSKTGPMSQNELARRAGVDSAFVYRLEMGRTHARRETVEAFAEGLGLSPIDRDRLLIAAGYWPWPDQAEDGERALAAIHGDLYAPAENRRRTG